MARWYFLACLSFALSLVAGLSPIYELRGKKAHLLSNIPGPPDNILWKHDGNKVVEFAGQEEEVYRQYINRITLDWHSAELNISDLRYEDSGEYELEALVKGKLHKFQQTLRVIDHVPEPTIKCDLNDGGSSNVSGELLCSATSGRDQSSVTFKWTSHGPVQLGQYLTIPLGDKYDDEVYSCEVSNPRSHNTATFAAKDCYPDTSAIMPIIIGLVALISILLVCLSVLCCKLKKKACFRQQNVEAGSPETKGSAESRLIDRTPTIPSQQRLFPGSAESAPIDRTPTIPSKQRLVQEDDRDEQPPQPGHVRRLTKKFEAGLPNPATGSDEEAAEDEEKHPLINGSPTHPSTELPGREAGKGSDEEAAEDEEKCLLVNGSPTHPSPEPLGHEAGEGHDINSQDDSQDEDEMPQKGSAESPRIDRTPTIPSKQRLVQEHDRDEQPPQPDENKDEEEETPSPSTPRCESLPLPDPNNLTSNEKDDAEDDQLSEPEPTEAPQSDSSDAERENEQEPATVSPEKVGSDLDSSAAPEHSESEKEEAEDEKAKSPPANVAPPIAKPRFRRTPNSPNVAPEDSAGEHKGDASSDQVNPGTESSREGETNKSDASNDDEQSPPVLKQNDQDAAEKDSDSESDNHEKDLYSAPPQKPESPAPTKQDNGSADACQESAEAALKEPVHKDEGKAKHDSDESDEEKNDA